MVRVGRSTAPKNRILQVVNLLRFVFYHSHVSSVSDDPVVSARASPGARYARRGGGLRLARQGWRVWTRQRGRLHQSQLVLQPGCFLSLVERLQIKTIAFIIRNRETESADDGP